MNGFLVVDKPAGITSSGVVAKARRALGIKKIGHMGTLDPLATGVLPLAVGKATRMFDYFIEKKKRYTAEFVFGQTTDTLDAAGQVTEIAAANFTTEELVAAARSLTGEILQVPPAYSAKSVGGVRSYKLARQGREVELPPKKVTVYDFCFSGQTEGAYRFEITCSGGTYIRALARDLARLLGTVGYMKSLRRTASGIFTLDEAVKIEDISCVGLISIERAVSEMTAYNAPDELYKQLSHGVKTVVAGLPADKYFVVFCQKELFGIGTKDEKGRLVLKTNLKVDE